METSEERMDTTVQLPDEDTKSNKSKKGAQRRKSTAAKTPKPGLLTPIDKG